MWMIKNWFKKYLQNRETRNKIKITIDNYEKGQIVRITNHIQHLKNSDYIIYKPPTGLQKGINKEVWETKAIVLNNRTNNCKVQVIETTHEDDMFKKDSIWKVDKDALKKVQYRKTHCQIPPKRPRSARFWEESGQ